MNTLPLDPEIAALAEEAGAPSDPIPWADLFTATGCSRDHYFAALASGLLMAGERLLAGYRAREDRARRARHNAYSCGAVNPPTRETLADRVQRSVDAWGTRKAVA